MCVENKPIDVRRAVLAGVAGSAAYLIEQWVDLKLVGFPGDDLKLLGMIPTRHSPAWRVVGTAMHVANGVALALCYATVARNRLPGPPALRGLALGQIENAAFWPAVPLVIDRYHPAVRSGNLPRLNTPRYALQAILRHVAYGLIVGWVYG